LWWRSAARRQKGLRSWQYDELHAGYLRLPDYFAAAAIVIVDDDSLGPGIVDTFETIAQRPS